MLNKAGIKTKVEAVEFGVFAKKTQAHQMPEFMYAAWGNNHFDVWDTVNAVVKTAAMFSWYSNEEADKLIDLAGKTIDPEQHAEYLRQLLRILPGGGHRCFFYFP